VSGTLSTTHLSIQLDDQDLEALGMDPWQERGWAGADLLAFVETLRALREQIHETAKKRLLARHRRRELESWMAPLLERELIGDHAYRSMGRVLEVADRAQRDSDSLLFVID
jgi:hypothetical protein